ncbi:MAG: hypothetical protein RTU92_07585 [Candidatus Thorarchaeota archaeon]
MAEKERIRRKEKSTTSVDTKIQEENIEAESESEAEIDVEPTTEDSKPSVIERTQIESEIQSITTIEPAQTIPEILLPNWGDSIQTEWMYHIPIREEDREMWAEEWSDFMIVWCREKDVHVMSFSLFVGEPPFNELHSKIDAFRLIGEKIVDKDVGKWLEGKKRRLRVYWRFLEEWADVLYQWALERGAVRIDVKSLIIQNARESFSKLPEDEIHSVLELLVDRGHAEWVDKKKGAIILKI